jgi:hypothetical protein
MNTLNLRSTEAKYQKLGIMLKISQLHNILDEIRHRLNQETLNLQHIYNSAPMNTIYRSKEDITGSSEGNDIFTLFYNIFTDQRKL